jgi:hypothetical protein
LGVAATGGFAFGAAGAAAGFDLGFFSFVLLGSSSIPRKHMNFMKLLNAAMALACRSAVTAASTRYRVETCETRPGDCADVFCCAVAPL